MSVWTMEKEFETFPMLKEVMVCLSKGVFIASSGSSTAELHSAIKANEKNYILLLDNMGYTLLSHPQYKFYYIEGSLKNKAKSPLNIGLFVAVMLEFDSNFEQKIKQHELFNMASLPYLSDINLVQKMELNNLDNKGLRILISRMNTQGLLSINKDNSDLFIFENTIQFYIDIYFRANQINRESMSDELNQDGEGL